jgi:aminomethyltransferase
LVTNEQGGILDDTVITNAGDYVYMVVNGATKFGDMEHFNAQLAKFQGDVTMEYSRGYHAAFGTSGPRGSSGH